MLFAIGLNGKSWMFTHYKPFIKAEFKAIQAGVLCCL